MVAVSCYLRVSDDSEGLGLGIARQEADCRQLAALRGWEVVSVRVDNDLSAFKPTVKRPQFEQLLTELAAGVIDGVVCYDLDRFARQPIDVERAIRIYDSRPLVFATVQGDLDLATPDGRTLARVMVAFANKSSMDTSRRVSRKHEELRQLGIPVGPRRAFGYQADRVTIDEQEAQLIKEAAEDVINGYPIHGIARRWNDLGVVTPYGNKWVAPVVRNIMISPTLAGYRTHKGQIVRDADGNPVMARRPPILDIPTWEALIAELHNPTRYGPHIHRGGRKRLLTGLARCGICSNLLSGDFHSREQIHVYNCKPPTSRQGCGKITVSGPRLDELITELVLRYFDSRHIEHHEEPWDDHELVETTGRITELMGQYTSGTLSGDVVFPAVSKLEAQATKLRADRAAWTAQQVTTKKQPENVWAAWEGYDVLQRHLLIESVIQAVVVKPAQKKGGRFDKERIETIWLP